MSHFAVMVITDSEPTEATLAEVLQPYHEFECTGIDDKYIQAVDKTEEAKQDYATYNDEKPSTLAEFCTDWFGLKKLVSPEQPDLSGEHKYGYVLVDSDGNVEKVIRRTNPNKKWDYWRVGGRYRSKLQVKAGATSAVSSTPSYEWRDQDKLPEGFDSARVADIDWCMMKSVAVQARRDWAMECISKCGLSREDFDIGCRQQKESHAKWMELPPDARPRGDEYDKWLRDSGYAHQADALKNNWQIPQTDGMPLDEWIESAPPIAAFAVVKDGNWYEKGRMGWWACVTDEDDQWETKFEELVASLQPTQWITFVDCHI